MPCPRADQGRQRLPRWSASIPSICQRTSFFDRLNCERFTPPAGRSTCSRPQCRPRRDPSRSDSGARRPGWRRRTRRPLHDARVVRHAQIVAGARVLPVISLRSAQDDRAGGAACLRAARARAAHRQRIAAARGLVPRWDRGSKNGPGQISFVSIVDECQRLEYNTPDRTKRRPTVWIMPI